LVANDGDVTVLNAVQYVRLGYDRHGEADLGG
jgi:hypothetical protein